MVGVTKRYGENVALNNVDLDIQPGEILGLLGPNGAGKTTLVSIVATLLRADSGTVTVCGIDVRRDATGVRRRLGLAPQELGIYPLLSVRENLVFFGELAGLRSSDLRRRIDEVAEDLELSAFMDRRAQFMSGGEKRRLHTAMALLHRPSLLLLDEPTSGVDVTTRAHLIQVVRKLAADGAAVCYSTHYLPEVEALEASVAIIDKGRVIAKGSIPELIQLHSQPALDLVIDGPMPESIALRSTRTEVFGNRIVINCVDPAIEAGRILADLGDEARNVKKLQFIVPSLEAVFLSLTGRLFEEEGRDDQDPSTITVP